MVLDRFIKIQIYNATETAVQYDNTDEGITWGITDSSIKIVNAIIDKDLKFGELNSGEFSIQLFGLNVDLTGRKIKVSCIETVDAPDILAINSSDILEINTAHDALAVSTNRTTRTVGLFTGWIDSCKLDNSGTYRDITAYDWLYWHREDEMLTWWESLWPTGTTSRSLGYIRNSLLTYLGITFHDVTTALDSTTFTNVFDGITSLKLNLVLPMLLEISSTCIYVNGAGELQLVQLSTTTDYDISDNIEGENSTWENYTTKTITGVGIYDSSNELAQLYGTGTNVYNISGNIFLLSKTASQLNTICASILSAIQNITYVPAQVKLIVSDLTHILGKRVHTEKGNTYIFRRTLSGSFLVDEEIQAQATKDTITDIVDSYNNDFVNSYKIARVKKDLDEFSVDYADFKEDTEAKFAVTYNKIVLHVKANEHLASAELNADPSGLADFKIQADNIDFIANDSIQLTSKSLGIYSTNFQVTPEGNVTCNNLTANTSGTIGGWTIGSNTLKYTTDSTHFIQLNSANQSIVMRDGDRKVVVTTGGIKHYFNEGETAYFRSENYTGTSSATNKKGTAINIESGASYFDLGYYDTSASQYYTALMINNGLNPDGITDKVIVSGTARFRNRIYVNGTNYMGSGTYTYNSNDYSCLWNNSHVYVGGHLFLKNNLYLEGYVLGALNFMSTNDYIQKGTWTIAGTTYHGLYIARHLFTNGRIMSEGVMKSYTGFHVGNDTVIIDSTSNNHVTGSNIYKGLGVYDSSSSQTRYTEFYGAANTDGTIRGYILARNVKTDGTEVYNQLGCGVKKDGTLTYNMTSPSAFRQAISVDGIGETTDNNAPSAQTCASGSWKSVATISSLPAGKYLLIGTVNFDANSNGNRYADISTAVDGNPISRHAYVASKNASGKTSLQMVCPINISSATTYHLNAYQDSGSSIDAIGQLTAIKIRG